jgi:phage-related tail protein
VPFFASGTNNAPGGLAVVGEKGPELVNLPRGSQVIPNDV